jgi:lysophospholipase L1-like esterase
MSLGVAGLGVMLPAVSDACHPVPAASGPSAGHIADAIAPGSDVLIVGDSYTTGRGSSDNVHGWAQDIAAEREWNATIDGIPGTGYVNTNRGRAGRTLYVSRIEQKAALTPDLVIVQGSQNDWLTDPASLQKAVERTLRQAEAQWPNAVVVAVGPSAPQPRAESTTGINAAVSAGAHAVGVPYIDAIAGRWFTSVNSRSFAAPDQQHLNDAGYRYLAAKVSSALDDLAKAPTVEQCR